MSRSVIYVEMAETDAGQIMRLYANLMLVTDSEHELSARIHDL
jgi:hypothetical protein